MNSTIFQTLIVVCVLLGISGCVGGAATGDRAVFDAGVYAWFCLAGMCFFFNSSKKDEK